MKKIDWDLVWEIAIALFAVGIFGLMIYGIATADKRAEKACAELSEEIGHPTQYVNSTCYVEVCEGHWVKQEDVIYFLDVCDG